MAHQYPSYKHVAGIVFYLANFLAIAWAWPLMITLLIIPLTTIPAIGYLIYLACTNYSDAVINGYTNKPLFTWAFWKWMGDYFNYSLVKTSDLPPTQPYLFCCAPHGIFSFGATISTSAIGFEKIFPGLDVRISTLNWNFKLPFGREMLHLWGAVGCSFKTLVAILSRGSGSSVVLEVGGTQESLYCHRGVYDIVLEKRKGFVKVAMASGAALVPVFFFGETNTYEVVKAPSGSLMDRWQKLLMSTGGYTMPSFKGAFAMFPFKTTITGVVGAPIPVKKYEGDLSSPEAAVLVDKYHAQFKSQVLGIWEKYKDVYAKDRVQELQIVM